MASIHEAASAFLARLGEVETELTTFQREMHDRPQQAIDAMQRVIDAASAPAPGHGESPLAKAARRNFQATSDTLSAWKQRQEDHIRSQAFIRKFERSLIVLIYGKVNSGKSTLGNFIAGIPFRGVDGNPYADCTPRFDEHASSGLTNRIDRLSEIDLNQDAPTGFATKATECTSSIQEFTIGGLSWIDCPGIHAVTKKNEALAKEYADNAELIIYITSADAALRRSDRDELLRFASQGKPVLLVVSKFDIMEEIDFREDGTAITVCLPRPAESRQQIQSWLEDQINDSNVQDVLQNRQYCFVSTRLATRALQEGDADLFEQSGIPALYHQLTNVISGQAVALKTRNPRQRFNALIAQLLGQPEDKPADGKADTVFSLRQRFGNDVISLRRAQADLMSLGKPAATRIRCKAEPDILGEIHRMAQAADAGEQADTGALSAIAGILQRHTREVLADEISRVLDGYNRDRMQIFAGFGSIEIPDITAVYDTIEVSEKTIYGGTGKAVGGGLGGWGGAAAGFAMGGPIGAVIGGIVGGLAGGAVGGGIGESFAGTRSVKVKVGNNVQDVAKKVMEQIETRLPDEIDRILASVADEYLRALEKASDGMIASLDHMQRSLTGLRYDV